MSFGYGDLHVFPISGKLRRDTEILGKMDPYCKFVCGPNKRCSAIHKNGGKFPQWKDNLVFHLKDERQLEVEVWDSDTMSSDDLVGTATIFLEEALKSGSTQKWYTLSYKGKNAGEVLVKLEFKRGGEQSPINSMHNNPNAIPMRMSMGNNPNLPQNNLPHSQTMGFPGYQGGPQYAPGYNPNQSNGPNYQPPPQNYPPQYPGYPQNQMPPQNYPGYPQGGPQYPQQGGPQYPQQGGPQYPQQGGPQYPQQGGPQYPQQGGPQYPQQGGPQYGHGQPPLQQSYPPQMQHQNSNPYPNLTNTQGCFL